MRVNSRKRHRPRTSITLSQEILDWVKGEIETRRFSSVSHAVEYALYLLKEERGDSDAKKIS